MKDYIVFSAADNYYALEVAFVERIVQLLPVTPIPRAHPYVEGMVSYEKKVTKVVNFRRMTGQPTCEEALRGVFERSREGYLAWGAALRGVAEGGDAWSLSPDRRVSELGEQLERFASHDSEVMAIVKKIRPLHLQLLEQGKEALWAQESDPIAAQRLLDECSQTLLPQILMQIGALMEYTDAIASHLQKMIIFRNAEQVFAIKVDTIEDMAQIDSTMTLRVDEGGQKSPFLEMEGVVELNGRLVNVIKTVRLPVREGE